MATSERTVYRMRSLPPLNRSSVTRALCRSPSWTRSSSTSAAAKPRRTPRIIEAVCQGPSATITGQKAIACQGPARALLNFKLREGTPIGFKVTLRGERMYEFLDRLFNVALPRVRDFRGINGNAFDGRGNYAFGLKEQMIFPEIEYEKVDKVRGMDVCFAPPLRPTRRARSC